MNTLWVVGDSTVSSHSDTYCYNVMGYGSALQPYFDKGIQVKNIALAGRSSKSFLVEPEYKELIEGMSEGDYLLIGFGHNDEKTEAARFTVGSSDLSDKRSIGYVLYKNYIKPAEAVGCQTILTTPVVRRTPDGKWTKANLHITENAEGYPGGNYPKAILELGERLDNPVIDMTSITKKRYDEMGPEKTIYLHGWTSNKGISVDNTHPSSWGARVHAFNIACEIMKNPKLSKLASHIVGVCEDMPLPDKDKYLIQNELYVPVEFNPDIPDSKLWEDYEGFKGTVFGNIGTEITKEYFAIERDANGNLHMSVADFHGKISESMDGIAFCYKKVPADKLFTLTADMTINEYALNDQVSFGLMVRDDCYCDLQTVDVLGDYVAAAPLALTKGADSWNCFARKDGVLTQGSTVTKEYKPGDKVKIKLVSTNDGYAATFADEDTITAGFDFRLTSVDPENVYVGMFVCRNADVTFSNIKLTFA